MPLKMYILIKEDVDLGHAILAAAHASLGGYLTFTEWRSRMEASEIDSIVNTDRWQRESFRKVICKVNDKEFEKAKEYPHHRVMTESGLDDQEVAIVFAPREEWPKFFKFLRLYR